MKEVFCDICGQAIAGATALAQHHKFKHAKPTVPCLHCPRMFFRVYSRDKHIRYHHKDPNTPFWSEEKEKREEIVAAAVALAQKEMPGVSSVNEGVTSAATLAAILKTNALEKVTGGGGNGDDTAKMEKEETMSAEANGLVSNEKECQKRVKTIPCPACLKVFHNVPILKNHIRQSHPDLDPNAGSVKKKKKKKKSDAAEIPPPLMLGAEMAAGSDVPAAGKKFGCPECPKTFAATGAYRLE